MRNGMWLKDPQVKPGDVCEANTVKDDKLSRGCTITGIFILGRLVLRCHESGNFGTRPSYDGISQLLGIAQVRFPGRK